MHPRYDEEAATRAALAASLASHAADEELNAALRLSMEVDAYGQPTGLDAPNPYEAAAVAAERAWKAQPHGKEITWEWEIDNGWRWQDNVPIQPTDNIHDLAVFLEAPARAWAKTVAVAARERLGGNIAAVTMPWNSKLVTMPVDS